MEKIIIVEGMTCNHCVASVREALEKLGVENMDINLESKKVTVTTDIKEEKLRESIEEIGFDVEKIY